MDRSDVFADIGIKEYERERIFRVRDCVLGLVNLLTQLFHPRLVDVDCSHVELYRYKYPNSIYVFWNFYSYF